MSTCQLIKDWKLWKLIEVSGKQPISNTKQGCTETHYFCIESGAQTFKQCVMLLRRYFSLKL